MEKKNYKMPQMAVETFVPNYYIASCPGEEIYQITGLGHSCHAVYDYEQDEAWGSEEAKHGNIKYVDPHGSVIYFTKEAAEVVKGLLPQSHVFYNAGTQDDLIINQGPNYGYGIHIAESAMNGATNPNTPIGKNDVGLWGSGGGHGIFVFDITQTVVKNQS